MLSAGSAAADRTGPRCASSRILRDEPPLPDTGKGDRTTHTPQLRDSLGYIPDRSKAHLFSFRVITFEEADRMIGQP